MVLPNPIMKNASYLMSLAIVGLLPLSAMADEPTIVELTQTGCQFLEPESTDYGYEPQTLADCKKINIDTMNERVAGAEPIVLKPGRYVFRVTNSDVPYELGFYLRAASKLKIPFMPRVSGGGQLPGTTIEYEVELEEGEYVYSCPLNPTIDYPLNVVR